MRWGSRASGLDALIQRREPSVWQQFFFSPNVFLTRNLYTGESVRSLPDELDASLRHPMRRPVSIVCISDTHNDQPEVSDGDILLHAGDLSQSGSRTEIQKTVDWLNTLPHHSKVVIAGNHDTYLDSQFENSKSCPSPKETIDWGDVIYLEDQYTTLSFGARDISIFGSPMSPAHGNWAFQYPRTKNVWKGVLREVDILLTHTPPKGHMDLNHGCDMLLDEIWRLKKKPSLHVFGHIHAGYGKQTAFFDKFQLMYENIMRGDTSIRALIALVYEYFKTRIFTEQEPGSETIMINASIVGGLRDELRRDPIKVWL